MKKFMNFKPYTNAILSESKRCIASIRRQFRLEFRLGNLFDSRNRSWLFRFKIWSSEYHQLISFSFQNQA